jgi:choline dehydrogenase-like flavoprotein
MDSAARGFYRRFGARPLSILARLEPAPDPNKRITLSHERNTLGQNKIRRYWRLAMPEKRTVHSAMRILGEEFGRLGLGRVKLADWLLRENDEWPENLSGGPHHIGTTRMATDPRKGVVDATCCVHGTDNLYIAGSSVFPTTGYAHPTLTIVALALRLAEQLKQRLHPGIGRRNL